MLASELDRAKATIENWSSKTISTRGGIYTLTRAAWLVLQEARELRTALDESIKLQAHYAELLNMHDGGRRHPFKSADEWIARLREVASREAR
jgi:hypothetical protein